MQNQRQPRRMGRNSAGGNVWPTESQGPRPKEIRSYPLKIMRDDGQTEVHTVHVFEPRPACDTDYDVMNQGRDMRANRWGSRSGQIESL